MFVKFLFPLLICQSLAVVDIPEKSGRALVDDGVKLMFFYGSSFGHHEFFELSEIENIFKHKSFRWWLKTVLYIHGYHETGYSKSVQTVVNAYFRRSDHNILVLNWGRMLNENSNLSILEKIGFKVSTAFARIFSLNKEYQARFHIVGFSFGAHLSGIIGHQIHQMTNGSVTIPRITGLDPPYLDQHNDSTIQITSSDAGFVDVIHTLHKSDNSTSSVTFWPNGEMFDQPGCLNKDAKATAKCDHDRAWQYWAESVANIHKHKFYSIKANSWSDFTAGIFTEPPEIVPMGIDCPSTISGNFYLKTNDHQPFARGKDGIASELIQSRIGRKQDLYDLEEPDEGRQVAPGVPTKSLDSASFIFYAGPTRANTYRYSLNRLFLAVYNPEFDNNKKTILFIHGYTEDQKSGSARTIVDAFLTRPDYNVLALDYAKLAAGNYFTHAFPNEEQLAPVVADALIKAFTYGLDINKFHLIGHSLGGQMSGNIGNYIILTSNGKYKLKRITALDPALPLFYYVRLSRHTISKNDADFVDIIHTDAGVYGSRTSGGTVDFWPNGGTSLQPGCPSRKFDQSLTDFCSHHRSFTYYAESVVNRTPRFLAIKANSWSDFQANRVRSSAKTVMGINCPPSARGNFYLQTNSKYPFARGQRGIVYHPV